MGHGEAFALKQAHNLGERQPDNIGVGADQRHYERTSYALDGIAAGSTLPLGAGQIIPDLFIGEVAEPDAGFDHALAPTVVGGGRQMAVCT